MSTLAIGIIAGLLAKYLVDLSIKRWNTKIRKQEYFNKHKAF